MNFDTMTETQRNALNREYRARLTIPDADLFLERAAKRSARVREELACRLDVPATMASRRE